jgi:hypothetical protein
MTVFMPKIKTPLEKRDENIGTELSCLILKANDKHDESCDDSIKSVNSLLQLKDCQLTKKSPLNIVILFVLQCFLVLSSAEY